MPTQAPKHNLARVGKFGAVGIINTVVDFAIFNVLYGMFGFHILIANAISTTITMIFSFLANRSLVFKAQTGSRTKQAVLFLAVTAFGLYVLQLGTIHLLTSVWTGPLDLAVKIIHSISPFAGLPDRFLRYNGAKAIGTIISLIWNYIMYKRLVFKS